MGKRILHLDILRVLACLMVVMMHSPMPGENAKGWLAVPLSYLTMPCIGIFFAVSGALLLPVTTHPSSSYIWIKRRLSKVIAPTIFWTFVFILIDGTIWDEGWKSSIIRLCSIPFSVQGHGVMWFMYTLISLYVIAPIISPWIEKASEKSLRFYLILWGISLCYPWLELIGLKINHDTTSPLYYISGYAGYFVLGYYLRHYAERIKMWWIAPAYILSWILLAAYKLSNSNSEGNIYDLFWYLSIFSPIMVIFWWKITKNLKLSDALMPKLAKLSNLTFGVYLSHIFIMRYGIWKIEFIATMQNYVLQTLIVICLTVIGSFLVSYIISLLPVGDYLIGYRKNASSN